MPFQAEPGLGSLFAVLNWSVLDWEVCLRLLVYFLKMCMCILWRRFFEHFLDLFENPQFTNFLCMQYAAIKVPFYGKEISLYGDLRRSISRLSWHTPTSLFTSSDYFRGELGLDAPCNLNPKTILPIYHSTVIANNFRKVWRFFHIYGSFDGTHSLHSHNI